MPVVIFSSDLQKVTGEERCRVSGSNYRELVEQVLARYSGLEPSTLMEMAVAIDGEIIHDPLLEQVGEDSEVHFLYKIAGG